MKYTIAANDEAARELAERRKLAKQCAEFAFNKPCGSKAALKDDQFKGKGLTYNMVEPLLKELKAGPKKNARVNATRDHQKQILTNDERIQLGEWILACAAGQVPKDRTAVSSKVKEMLRARQASNKARGWRGGSIALNAQEKAAMWSEEPRLSKVFFERFYAWWLVQGQGLCCCAQAIAAGLQPHRGGRGGGPGGSPVDVCVAGIGRSGRVLFRSRGRRTVRVHMRCIGHWGMSRADWGDQGVE